MKLNVERGHIKPNGGSSGDPIFRELGSSLCFTCTSMTKPVWSFEKISTYADTLQSTEKVWLPRGITPRIEEIDYSNAGNYYCHGRNKLNEEVMDIVQVIVYGTMYIVMKCYILK